MSGMNGNLVARAKGTENKMKLLFYGLGILPVELLFSECPRIGSREVDSWIPRHVVPEVFSGNHTLRLQPDGFHFHYGDNCRPLKFFMLPSSTNWHKDIQLKATDDIGLVLKALEPSNKELTLTSKNGWCILLEDQQPLRSPRAALFVVSGLEENKVFLHFERSARLSTLKFGNNEIEEHLPTHVFQPAEEKLEFIIEKGSTPQDLRMPRPQTRKQYSDRLIFTGDMLSKVLIFGHQYFCRHFLEKALRNNIPLCVLYGLFTLTIRISMERALKALVHRAWIETFYPEWNPNGRWKWFWKLLNYVPPVPFKKMMKYYLKLMLSVTLTLGMHSLSAAASLYWYAIYPKEELVALYLIIFFLRGLDWVFGIF